MRYFFIVLQSIVSVTDDDVFIPATPTPALRGSRPDMTTPQKGQQQISYPPTPTNDPDLIKDYNQSPFSQRRHLPMAPHNTPLTNTPPQQIGQYDSPIMATNMSYGLTPQRHRQSQEYSTPPRMQSNPHFNTPVQPQYPAPQFNHTPVQWQNNPALRGLRPPVIENRTKSFEHLNRNLNLSLDCRSVQSEQGSFVPGGMKGNLRGGNQKMPGTPENSGGGHYDSDVAVFKAQPISQVNFIPYS